MRFQTFCIDIIWKSKVLQHIHFADGFEDLVEYCGLPISFQRGLCFEVFLEWSVDSRYVIIASGTGHGGAHMPYQHSFGPTFALDTFTRIIDNIWIHMRYTVENEIGEAFG